VTDSRRGARLRAKAAEVVDAVSHAGRSLDRALASAEKDVADDDRGLLRLLCFGALRHHWRLQASIDALLSRPLRARDSVVNALLAVGLYQLSDTRIPDHAAVSQTVDAVRFLRRPKLAPLVNAVLRRALRDRILETEPSNEEARLDHPRWLIEAIRSDWPADAAAILAANNDRAPMWLRVNPAHGAAVDYLDRLAAIGIGGQLLDAAPQAVRLDEPLAVESLPGFAAGHVSVQDAAAQLAAPWLMQGLSGRVLDACAAPGGKSGHLLEIGGNRIDLTAIDIDATRLAGVAANLERLELDATLDRGDASKPEQWWNGEPFDGILLDAPCSASGVIRRHPDIKLLRRPDDVATLAVTQRAILDALWPLLAPGGRLLYVTCSIFSAENDAIIARFLEDNDDAWENAVLQNNNIRDLMRGKARGFQVLPGVQGLDGFYFACLERDS